jgi:hypothetical protein
MEFLLWCPGPDLNRYELFIRGILRGRFACFALFQGVSNGPKNGQKAIVNLDIRLNLFQNVPRGSVQTREMLWMCEAVEFSIPPFNKSSNNRYFLIKYGILENCYLSKKPRG